MNESTLVPYEQGSQPDELDELSSSSINTASSPSPPASEPELPPVRDHSYLPGTSHPLHIERPAGSSCTTNTALDGTSTTTRPDNISSSRTPRTTDLAVLELPGVVLFPGSTFPLRFSQDSPWMEHLGRKIEASRATPGQAEPVRLGILTTRPQSDHPSRRRQSWTRQGFGPVRLRRISQQLIQELGDMDELSQEEEEHTAAVVTEPALPLPLPQADRTNQLIRINQQMIQELEDMDELVDEEDNAAAVTEPALPLLRPRADRTNQHPRRATRTQREEDSSSSSADSTNNDGSSRNRRDRFGFLDRIGTIVTVINTHGDEVDAVAAASQSDSSHVWRPLEEGGQLILTTLATGRFRIVGYRCSEDLLEMHQIRMLPFPTSFVRTFLVEEIDDSPIPLPPNMNRPFSSTCRLSCPASERRELPSVSIPSPSLFPHRPHNQMVHSLSVVSAIPELVYQNNWPWNLIAMIRESMARSRTLAGFLEAADSPSLDNDNSDPTQISFWMASNLPFTQTEKVRLLEMHSTVERLRFIYHKVVREERLEPLITCRTCSVPLSRAMHMFTVAGAEGTTGAYVNQHGVVHQTITIRYLNDDDVLFTGGAQTTDSWFPGYSWTIMSCSLCLSHLGWKFQRVVSSSSSSLAAAGSSSPPGPSSPPLSDRPDFFYGLSAGSVSIVVPSQHHRRTTMRGAEMTRGASFVTTR